MSTAHSAADILTQQFFDRLIGVTPGSKRLSYRLADRQAQPERTLLAVEAEALIQRLAGQQARSRLNEFAHAHVHEQVADELFRKLVNIEQVMTSLFQPGESFYPILDLLSLPGVTVNKLDPLICKVPWLHDELIDLVNRSRVKNKKPSVAAIKDIKTALRFLGVDNLRLMVPVYLMRHSLPHSTEPFTGLKDRLWEYSLATALAARRLAEQHGEYPYNAFCAGLFHTLGHLVVTRNYLRLYKQIRQQELLKAQQIRDTELTNALDTLEPDGGFLSNCLQEFAAVLSADITSRWLLKRLPLCQTLDQLAEGIGYHGSSPLARLVQQARVYVQWRQLQKSSQLSEQQTADLLAATGLTADDIQLLNRENLKRLKLAL